MTQNLTVFQPSPASIMDTFKGPPPPENEVARLQTVQMLVPTSDDDPVLASLCKLVCSLLKVPAAGVCTCPLLSNPRTLYLRNRCAQQPCRLVICNVRLRRCRLSHVKLSR